MTTIFSWDFAAALTCSFSVCALLIVTQRWHGSLSLDHDLRSAQKIHHSPVPRIGGLGLVMGILAGILINPQLDHRLLNTASALLISAIPVFLAGLIEDLTKKVSVRTRLYASFTSALLAILLVGAQLSRLDTPPLDVIISYSPLAVIFTCFAVGGMTNAINIIDGLNGLASGTVILMLCGLALVADEVRDVVMLRMCCWGVAATLGFMLLNFPFGRIFLGDCGAYLAGFWVAECGVLLLARNPDISTWCVLLACFFPVWETLFSMYRRHIIGKTSSGQADFSHMHHLIFMWATSLKSVPSTLPWLRHSVTSSAIWFAVLSCQLLAWRFHDNTKILVIATIGMAGIYTFIYRRLSHATFTRSA